MGKLDKDGCLTVTGRCDNMFISGGENIFPEEIEKALLKINGIEQAVVVPKEDKEFGHRPVAFLKFSNPLSKQEIIRCLQADLPSFKIPIVFYPWPPQIEFNLKVPRKEFLNIKIF
ncbi:MAG: hypothetical protein HQL13_07185 [Candidatus Omnitrophica bacterium]|nr:hypothetical protein [Candidatus Omnitrophota bacterium]